LNKEVDLPLVGDGPVAEVIRRFFLAVEAVVAMILQGGVATQKH
jgi:hypothetical protein